MPMGLVRALPLWLAGLWWGSLTTLGFFVVPMLFAKLPSPAMAGNMAAQLFTVQTGISAVCGIGLLLVFRLNQPAAQAELARLAIIFVAAGLFLALLVEFGVSPQIVARENMALWHRVGSLMYLGQWVCSAIVFGKLIKR
jgi:hypothetical protein